MIDLHDAIRAINSNVVSICNEDAYDKDGNLIAYDMAAAQAKLAELQAAEDAEVKAKEQHRLNAISKLSAIGLTQDEINALIGA